MSRLTCSFCTHSNPEGSKFCNECGSPLHLVPCAQCEAINNESDARCCRCGAPLSAAATAQIAEGPALAAEFAQAEPGAAISSVPIALADHLDAFPWDPGTKAEPEQAAAVEEHSSSSAEAEAEAVAAPDAVAESPNAVVDEEPDDVPLPPYRNSHVEYDAVRRRRTPAIVLGVALLGVAAAIYWPAADHPRPADSPVTDAAPAGAATSAARGPEAQPPAAGMPPESREPASGTPLVADQPQPVADPAPSNAGPSEAAATQPPSAGADIAPRVAVSPAENADAPAPASRQTVQAGAVKGAADKGRGAGEARRRAGQQGRTKEQAERDALATQRLIARDLGATPRAPSGAQPAPAP
jgi:hypothetical protein